MNGLEPISARELHKFLTEHGCRFHRQVGSHLTGTGPQGQIVRIPDPGSNHPVTTLVVAELGRTFGKNVHDTRIWLGYGTTGKSSVTRKRAARATKATKPVVRVPEVADTASRLRVTADQIYRSGKIRKQAGPAARSELHAIAIRLDQWCEQQAASNGGAA